jgi:uncharacterized repeat protein (TIGR03803 family)
VKRQEILQRSRSDWKIVCSLFLLCLAIRANAQTFTKLIDFDGTDGAGPMGSLVQGPNGSLYGTTSFGGSGDGGTVFRLRANGDMSVLYSFCVESCTDGEDPETGMVLAADSNFYGSTAAAGPNNGGTIFRASPQGLVSNLYAFCAQPNCSDGATPVRPLIQAVDGDLYGTTEGGGDITCNAPYGCGTVFKLTTAGVLTTLHVFEGSDGQMPLGGLVQATDGNFYGTTNQGGVDGYGTIFKITRTGSLTTLFSFTLGFIGNGVLPFAGLLQAIDGNLYGTAAAGGTGGGTVFKITLTGKFTVLYSFCAQPNCTDGSSPGELVQATDGNLYGVTYAGGTDVNDCYGSGCGTIFSITPRGGFTTLHSFYPPDGTQPEAAMIQDTTGLFFGGADGGGSNGHGTIYSLNMGLAPFVTFVRAAGKVGQTGGILGQGFTGATAVSLNGVPANFTVVSDTYIKATVPAGATTGYVTVTTPTGVLTSNVPFHVLK